MIFLQILKMSQENAHMFYTLSFFRYYLPLERGKRVHVTYILKAYDIRCSRFCNLLALFICETSSSAHATYACCKDICYFPANISSRKYFFFKSTIILNAIGNKISIHFNFPIISWIFSFFAPYREPEICCGCNTICTNCAYTCRTNGIIRIFRQMWGEKNTLNNQ